MRTALAALLLTITLPAAAQVYMWTDENGRKHFGSAPPAGDSEMVHIGETNSADAPEARQRTMPEPQRRVEEPGSDWACDWAKRRLQRLEGRWEDVKRQGYTVADQESYRRQKADVMREIRDDC